MPAEVDVTIKGETYTLALPIGGIEEVAKINQQIEEVWQVLSFTVNRVRLYRFDELKAVLKAGCKWGGVKSVGPGEIIEDLGVRGAANVAAELLRLALGISEDPTPGKDGAVEEIGKPGS